MVRPPSVDRSVVDQILDGTHHESKSISSSTSKMKSSESKLKEQESARRRKKKSSKVSRKKKGPKKKRSVRDPNAQVEEEQRRMELHSEPKLEEQMSSLAVQDESKEEPWNESMFRLTFFTYLNFYYHEVPESKSYPEYTFSNTKVIGRASYVIPPVGSLSQLPLVSLITIFLHNK